jgi:hypothetical protein
MPHEPTHLVTGATGRIGVWTPVTAADTPLPFPEGFDVSAPRAAMPRLFETPLADGTAETTPLERALSSDLLARQGV